jgi:hypothetical protein
MYIPWMTPAPMAAAAATFIYSFSRGPIGHRSSHFLAELLHHRDSNDDGDGSGVMASGRENSLCVCLDGLRKVTG